MLAKIFSRRHTDFCFLIFKENKFLHFMQIVFYGKNKKHIISLSYTELAQSVVKVNGLIQNQISQQSNIWAQLLKCP